MTDQTVTKALAPYERLKQLVTTEDIQARFKQILGEKAPGFLASVINTVYLSNGLRDCDPNSVLTSAIKAAILDLPVDPNLGFAWLIAYNNHGKKEAQFQMGYKGFVQLALRSSQYQAINAVAIYEGERVIEDRLTGAIKLNGKKISDEVIGFCGYFKLLNGFEKYYYMTVDQVHAHAKKYSKSYGRENSAWNTNFVDMGKKTVLKAIISKYGIMSITMMRAFEEEAHDDLSVRLTADQETGEIVDTTMRDVPPPSLEERNPEQSPEQSENSKPTEVDILNHLVELNIFENEFEARGAMTKIRLGWDTFEKAETLARAYMGWRAMGANSKQAAESVNNGEMPK